MEKAKLINVDWVKAKTKDKTDSYTVFFHFSDNTIDAFVVEAGWGFEQVGKQLNRIAKLMDCRDMIEQQRQAVTQTLQKDILPELRADRRNHE